MGDGFGYTFRYKAAYYFLWCLAPELYNVALAACLLFDREWRNHYNSAAHVVFLIRVAFHGSDSP